MIEGSAFRLNNQVTAGAPTDDSSLKPSFAREWTRREGVGALDLTGLIVSRWV